MRIAINGMGIAGPTLAYWLRRFGHDPVLFEQAPQLRTGGYLIDFWGLGYELAERMGIISHVLDQAYRMERMRMVDGDGVEVAGLDLATVRQQVEGRFVSIARSDLAATIFRACEGVPAHFGVSVVGIRPDADGVRATLSDGTTDRFDLVVGADGLHSHVRELVFGPEARCERPLGCHVAAFRIHGYPRRDELTYVSHTVPGRQVARISLRGDDTLVLLVCRSELMAGDAPPRVLLRRVFGAMRWEVPAILDRMDEADDLYVDRVSQIQLAHWTDGRVALLGDAAACVSLLAGEGTGLAMVEAYVLAGELHRAGGDYARALQAYEAQLRPTLAAKQKAALRLRGFFVPRTGIGLKARDWAVNLASIPWLTKLVVGSTLRDDFVLPDY
jgi:2-polyprenyl-6-methoxyphenol hydroxylase-like FAD-dependent oxidoreductase